MNKALGILLKRYKSAEKLGEDLGVSRQYIHLIKNDERLPNAIAIKIERLTDGEFKAVDLTEE